MALQATNLDLDLMKKINMAIGGGSEESATTPAKPHTMVEDMQALKNIGIKVGRK